MKVVNQEINMIAWFRPQGKIRPIKFQMTEGDENIVIKVDRVVKKDVDKIAGVLIHIFTCQSIIKGIQKIYELRYNTKNLNWILYKI